MKRFLLSVVIGIVFFVLVLKGGNYLLESGNGDILVYICAGLVASTMSELVLRILKHRKIIK